MADPQQRRAHEHVEAHCPDCYELVRVPDLIKLGPSICAALPDVPIITIAQVLATATDLTIAGLVGTSPMEATA